MGGSKHAFTYSVILFYEPFSFVLSSIQILVEISKSFDKESFLPGRFYLLYRVYCATETVNNSMSDFRCQYKDGIFLRKSLQIMCLIQKVKVFVSEETFKKWHAYF